MNHDRFGRQEIVLLLHYVILLSLNLMSLTVPAGTFWIVAACVALFFAGIAMLAQWWLPDEKRVGRSVFLAYLALMGLLITTDFVLFFTNPFESRRE